MNDVSRHAVPLLVMLLAAAGFPMAGSSEGQFRGIATGATLGKALILSDGEILGSARQACTRMDQTNLLAPEGSPLAERLARLTANFHAEDGLSLTFKVYMVDEVNAWAMANGCVRVYSGLLDILTDDEVQSVVGHEIGHVKLGHTKAKMRTALLARGVRQGAAAGGDPNVGVIASGELGDLGEKVVNAQFSQKEERAADDYGFRYMLKHGYDPHAMVTMFRKLPSKKGGLLASHPGAEARAKRIEGLIRKRR